MTQGQAPELKVLSTLGIMGVLEEARPALVQLAGQALAIRFAPTKVLLDDIHAGVEADLAILTAEAVEQLMAERVLRPASRVDLARSFVGVAVRAGTPHPDISSTAAFTTLLREARSIGVSRAGASGIYFSELVQRLGLATEVAAKSVVIPSGLTGELVARGQAEIAIQQVSELMVVPGIEVVGRLPSELGGDVTFVGATFLGTGKVDSVQAVLNWLSAPAQAATYRRRGLEPVPRVD